MPTAPHRPASRLAAVKQTVRLHFAIKGKKLLRDGKTIDPKYPANRRRPRSIFIGKFGRKSVTWTVAQVRILLHLGDLPEHAKIMYLDNDCQNDALENLRLVRRSPDRPPRRSDGRPRRLLDEYGDPILGPPAPLPKGVTSWRIGPTPEGSDRKVYPKLAAWIRIGDNELLLGLFDDRWDAQKAIQAARDAAWHAILSPNDHERMAAMAALIRKRRSPTVLQALTEELKRLDVAPPGTPDPDIVSPSSVGDALIHDGWHRRKTKTELK